MDRQINYPGQVPLETDLLQSNQNIMIGLAKLSQAIFGTSGMATGFGTTQTVVPSLNVLVAPGEVYSQQNLEATAVSSLPQDLAHSIVKQGILLDAATVAITPPGTPSFSVNYLIQVGYQDSDSGSTVLPYYNASNPSVAYSGPANSGAAQPTVRKGIAVVSAKAGTAATTGTQTTPAPDAGKLGLYVVTVANGAATIVNANISAYAGAPLLSAPVAKGRLLGIQVFSASGTYTPTVGTTAVLVRVQGGGGGGGGSAATAGGQIAVGTGGTGGAYGEGWYTTGFTGGIPVTVGAGGAGGTAGNNAGAAGGTSSFGSLLSCPPGFGGQGGPANAMSDVSVPDVVPSNPATGANLLAVRGTGGGFIFLTATGSSIGSRGGDSFSGSGPQMQNNGPGNSAFNPGAGGGGATQGPSSPARAGGNGAAGYVIVMEFA